MYYLWPALNYFFCVVPVTELAASLEESRDELQVVKRKNNALIKVTECRILVAKESFDIFSKCVCHLHQFSKISIESIFILVKKYKAFSGKKRFKNMSFRYDTIALNECKNKCMNGNIYRGGCEKVKKLKNAIEV